MMRPGLAILAALLIGVAPATAGGSEGKHLAVISTLNIRPALDTLKPMFETRTHAAITFTSQGAAATQKLVEGGAQGDVVVGSRAMLDALVTSGKVVPSSIADIAHSTVGIVVRADAPPLDVSTDEKLRAALIGAKSIAYPDPAKGSLGGNYFAGLLVKWGIAVQINAKAQLTGGGAPCAQAVADGKADIGINQVAEMKKVPGLRFLVPPPIFQRKIVMSAGVLVGAKAPRLAKRWVAFLASRTAAPAIVADGMEP